MSAIDGTTSAEVLDGGVADDTITGAGGNDTINGGEGIDTAVFAGEAADYRIGYADGYLTLTDIDLTDGDSGSASVSGVEVLRFGDIDLQAPPNGEFRANTTTSNQQTAQAVAVLSDGSFVICWVSAQQDGGGAGVYAQRYDTNGVALGSEFRVNVTTSGNQDSVAVTALSNGGFAVAWESFGQDLDQEGIFARSYDASGAALSGEIAVNTTTAGGQYTPSIAAFGNGYVVSWHTDAQDGSEWGVYTRSFAANGTTADGETLVNTGTLGDQYDSNVVKLADGGHVVSWTSISTDPDNTGIFVQRFDATGLPAGAATRVNTTTTNVVVSASTAAVGNGFVVTWVADGLDGSSGGIYAQIFDGSGSPVGAEFSVNTTTSGAQLFPCVTGLANGNFVVSWQSAAQDGDGTGIYARIFDGSGAAQGGEFLVNTTTVDDQRSPAIVALPDGGFLVGWESAWQDESLQGVYFQRFDASGEHLPQQIVGTAGADHIDIAGTGALTAAGLGGDDVYVVDETGDAPTENAAGGTDTVESSVGWALGQNFENLTLLGTASISGLGNGAANTMVGNGGNNSLAGLSGTDSLSGGDGDDSLSGGGGADTLAGGGGNDTYNVDSSDQFTEAGGGGFDTIRIDLSLVLGAEFENLVLLGTTGWTGTGNVLDNALTGNSGDNLLTGGAGDDTLLGATGNDTLNGGSGADNLRGGGGDDLYFATSGDSIIESANSGTDLVRADVSWTLSDNVENLLLTGSGNDGAGNGLANRITGNGGSNSLSGAGGNDELLGGAGDDTLQGDAGADTLRGGSGSDRYYVTIGDVIDEGVAVGTDTVESSSNWNLVAGLENLDLVGTSNTAGTGNALDNVLTGNSGSNRLDGRDGNDTLLGGDGADILTGSVGADRLVGGVGNDVYVVDSSDVLVESIGEGIDRVKTFADWTLDDNFEHLTLAGSDAISGTGNSANNRLLGNAGANTLSGSGGADTVSAAAGDDSIDGGIGADLLQGAAGADSIDGNTAGDRIFGGDGNDRLTGGQGNDSFTFDTALSATLNVDLITDFTHLADKIRLDDDVFTAFNATLSTTLAAGALQQGAGVTSAQDTDDRIIYDTSTGALYYDADGLNGDAAVQFATLGTGAHPAITVEDFLIVA